jgi:PBSX family phage terminase large subunit
MQPPAITVTYRPRGAAYDLFSCRDGMVCLDGPTRTGKTLGILMKIHLALLKYPGAKALMLRKTHASLTGSILDTYKTDVLHPLDRVKFHGGSAKEPPAWLYPNGAKWVVGGMDKPEKVLSTAYDIINFHEAIEATVTDIEVLSTRLSNNVMPYQQIIMDTNPSYPEHWLNKRMQDGSITRLISRHEDNPILFGDDGKMTAFGETYLARLDALTGVRYLRLRKGIWAAAEGTVYQDAWDSAINLIDRFPIPREWPRYLSIDFGYTNPFCCQWWAVDPDGRMYLYREIYMTQMLVEDLVPIIIEESGWKKDNGDPLPYGIIHDHDAEDAATLQKHMRIAGFNFTFARAIKTVSVGIQSTASRMRKAGDGKPRLYILRDTLVKVDTRLQAASRPYCTLHELDEYIWNEKKDAPVKENDHGLDPARYMVMHLEAPRFVETVKSLYH